MKARARISISMAVMVVLVSGPLFAEAIACEHPPSALILVRHACKADCGVPDPPLSARGQEQAEELVERLGELDVEAIFVTSYHRTRDTAAGVAGQEDLEPNDTVPLDELAAELCSGPYEGEAVLHVGHSNTLGDVIHALYPDFDYVEPACAEGWVMTFPEGGLHLEPLPASGVPCEDEVAGCCLGGGRH